MFKDLNELINQQHQMVMEYCKRVDKPLKSIKQIMINQKEYDKKENYKIKSDILKGITGNDDILKGVGK